MIALTIEVPANAKTRFVVIDECMFGYIQPQRPFSAGILASSVIRGASHSWMDGPFPLRMDGKGNRPATIKDFEDFRIGIDQYKNCRFHEVPTA